VLASEQLLEELSVGLSEGLLDCPRESMREFPRAPQKVEARVVPKAP
jgi:hypothetical protein